MKITVKKMIGYIIYNAFAKHLPVSYAIISGKTAKALRGFCARLLLDECGKNVNIEKGANYALNIKIGDNSGIGKNSDIGGFTSIGKNVMMGESCLIYTRNHCFKRCDIPMNEQGFDEYRPVIISDDVWIGARVTILPGVKIGTGAVIAAGTVVTKDIPDYSVVAGIPAKVIKSRKNEADI